MESSFFRFLNEQLYSTSSKNIELSTSQMEAYHKGFSAQCKLWDKDPLFIIYKWINSLFKGKSVKIVDIGAGEGILSSTLHHYKCLLNSVENAKKVKHFPIKPTFKAKVNAYDLYPVNKFVETANAAKIPLPDDCCHCAVFCLSLMGTDYSDFLKESNRLVKINGFIIIAEVQSRLVDCKPKFVKACCVAFGWKLLKQVDESHFCVFLFQKVKADAFIDKPFPKLLPCLYKKR